MLQLNVSTTATLGTEESGRCKTVAIVERWPLSRGWNKSEFMDCPPKKEIRSLSDDGSENGKKDKQNNNFARASRFFVHFSAVVARLQRQTV